jgi:hypothetical protein
MSENCARPGCGHSMLIHGAARCQASKFPLTCDCPDYRSPYQQAAWGAANASLAKWTDPEVGEYVGACSMEDALVGLLRAYP